MVIRISTKGPLESARSHTVFLMGADKMKSSLGISLSAMAFCFIEWQYETVR